MVGGIQIHSANHERDYHCYMIFGHEVRSKLPEMKRKTVGVPAEEVGERN